MLSHPTAAQNLPGAPQGPHTLHGGLQGPSITGPCWLLSHQLLLPISFKPFLTFRGFAYAVPSAWNTLLLSTPGFTPIHPLGLSLGITTSRKYSYSPGTSSGLLQPLGFLIRALCLSLTHPGPDHFGSSLSGWVKPSHWPRSPERAGPELVQSSLCPSYCPAQARHRTGIELIHCG